MAVGLWLRSQASRQAIPGLLPQFPVSVSGTSATPKPVAWNTRLLPTSATPREATGGLLLRGELREDLQADGHDALALRAVKTRLYETCKVIAAKPTVCSRVRNAAGSTGL